MSRKFAVVFSARPSIKLVHMGDFEIKKATPHDIRLKFQDISDFDQFGVPGPAGIQITVELCGESMEDSIQDALGWASGLFEPLKIQR